jgi:hypothetical protein
MRVKLMIVFWFSLIAISINLELHGSSIFSQAFCWVMCSGEATQILQTVGVVEIHVLKVEAFLVMHSVLPINAK